MSLLQIEHLSKSYVDRYSGEHTVALEDVSLEMAHGEFLSILGPSGCGKTTILNIAAGFVEPTSGQVLLRGKPIVGPGPDRGVVFQGFALFPWKTVKGNIAFGLKMRGVAREERDRVTQKFIDLVGLSGSEEKFPHELSGGMQQRVGVARVLANDPDVMLMDEPFASVDAQTRMNLQEEVTRIWESQRSTILFITHDVEEAVFLSDRVVVMSPGPGRIREVVEIDVPRPRRWEEMVDHDGFKRLTQRILHLIRREEPEADDGPTA